MDERRWENRARRGYIKIPMRGWISNSDIGYVYMKEDTFAHKFVRTRNGRKER